jgi:hypothetical protein
MTELIVLFVFFGWVSMMLKSSERSTGRSIYWSRPLPSKKRKGSVPRMRNPPPPPKTKCICNNISNHSPGGRCEACWSKITKPSSEPDWIRM